MRPIIIVFDELDRADGSARFAFGETCAVASVSGPIEARLQQENASRATVEVIIRPLHGVAATESRSLSTSIAGVLSAMAHLHQTPRALVQIVVQSLSPIMRNSPRTPSSLLAAYFNASSLALLRAGSLPLRTYLCAVPIARRARDNDFVIDPAADEKTRGTGVFVFDSHDQLIWSTWSGSVLDQAALATSTSLAVSAAQILRHKMRALARS
ncbi:ribosomal protein S5 domain 2-type protein [Auriculariales sp. MPI-PUGE-AT-0066]|nr:ribosomal protein S5 domain 2-type protein [Auriculariales sp. MPI-PUGE-AT-0066]